jgi:ATP-dependent 26S proteasome regulatory subunit
VRVLRLTERWPVVVFHVCVARPEKISAADIAAIAQEAGLQAVRPPRTQHMKHTLGWTRHHTARVGGGGTSVPVPRHTCTCA